MLSLPVPSAGDGAGNRSPRCCGNVSWAAVQLLLLTDMVALALALALALPFCNGKGHVLQPLLVGLRGADLGHDGAQQFVHQLQHLISILFDVLS